MPAPNESTKCLTELSTNRFRKQTDMADAGSCAQCVHFLVERNCDHEEMMQTIRPQSELSHAQHVPNSRLILLAPSSPLGKFRTMNNDEQIIATFNLSIWQSEIRTPNAQDALGSRIATKSVRYRWSFVTLSSELHHAQRFSSRKIYWEKSFPKKSASRWTIFVIDRIGLFHFSEIQNLNP